jgi:hypothetical protein
MNKLTYYFYFILAFILFSCDNKAELDTKEVANFYKAEYGIQTIQYENCEYIIYKDKTAGGIQMLHKQNCEYCKQRQLDQ